MRLLGLFALRELLNLFVFLLDFICIARLAQVWVLKNMGFYAFLAVRLLTGLFAGCNPIFKATKTANNKSLI